MRRPVTFSACLTMAEREKSTKPRRVVVYALSKHTVHIHDLGPNTTIVSPQLVSSCAVIIVIIHEGTAPLNRIGSIAHQGIVICRSMICGNGTGASPETESNVIADTKRRHMVATKLACGGPLFAKAGDPNGAKELTGGSKEVVAVSLFEQLAAPPAVPQLAPLAAPPLAPLVAPPLGPPLGPPDAPLAAPPLAPPIAPPLGPRLALPRRILRESGGSGNSGRWEGGGKWLWSGAGSSLVSRNAA